MKITFFILLLFITLGIGYLVGAAQYHPNVRIAKYKLGLVSFCDLIEADRFKVCPMMRAHEYMSDGGSITVYMCNDDVYFIETNSLTDKSQKVFKERLSLLTEFSIKKRCRTNAGWIYFSRRL